MTRPCSRCPPIFREVLVLRFQEQMKLEEIAKLVHIPVSTVKTRIYRGVMALRPLLRPAARKTAPNGSPRKEARYDEP